jgi:cellobiose-specific phosphotransferase system component IIA
VRRLLIVVGLILTAAACSGPPQKEIDQAQAALDSARAAGADKYATSEYAEASSSLQKAHDAVTQRDYRQALNYAIDSRQRSQEALRVAPEGKTRAHDAAVKDYDRTASRANELQTRLREADAARVPAKELQTPRTTLAEARQALQEASTAITAGNFEAVSKSLTEVRGKLDGAMAAMEKIPPRAARKKSGRT